MKLPSYRINEAIRKYRISEPVQDDSGRVVGVTQQANAWANTEDVIQRVADSSRVHASFQRQMGPLPVEYLWPRSLDLKTQNSDSLLLSTQEPKPGTTTDSSTPRQRRCVGPTYAKPRACPGTRTISTRELQWHIDECIGRITSPDLRTFMQQVVLQPEIKEVMGMQASSAPGDRRQRGVQPDATRNGRQFMAQCLQSAARSVCVEISKGWKVSTEQREVIYIATLLHGCKWGVERMNRGKLSSEFKPCSADEILFAVVREALHRFDDSASAPAQLLRSCMGWGCMEEVNPTVEDTRLCIALAIERNLKAWEV